MISILSQNQNSTQKFKQFNIVSYMQDVGLTENRLQVDGRSVPIHKNTQEYENTEQHKVLMPWSGDAACLIDRFDARANLDFWREPAPGSAPKLNDEEREVEEVCTLLVCLLFTTNLGPSAVLLGASSEPFFFSPCFKHVSMGVMAPGGWAQACPGSAPKLSNEAYNSWELCSL